MAWYEGAVQSKHFLNKIKELIGKHSTEWEVVGHHKTSTQVGDDVGVIFRPVNEKEHSYMTYSIGMPYITNSYTASSTYYPCVCVNVTQFYEYVPDEDFSKLGTFKTSWMRNLHISPRGRSSDFNTEFLGGTSPMRYLISIKPGHITMVLAHTNGTGAVVHGYVHFGKLLSPTSDEYTDMATLHSSLYVNRKTISGIGTAPGELQTVVTTSDTYNYCKIVNHQPSFDYNNGTTQVAFDHFVIYQALNGALGRLPIKSLQYTKGIVDKDLLDIGGVAYYGKLLDLSSVGTHGAYNGLLSLNSMYAVEK